MATIKITKAITTTRTQHGDLEAHVAGCRDLKNRGRHQDRIETIEGQNLVDALRKTDESWAHGFGMDYPVDAESRSEVWSIAWGSIQMAPCLVKEARAECIRAEDGQWFYDEALRGKRGDEFLRPQATPAATPEKVKISWWAIPDGGERIRRQATMAGRWGWDATCSCGWDSRTGGAVFRAVRRAVNEHKVTAHGLDAKL